MRSKQFLMIFGVILVVLAVLGFSNAFKQNDVLMFTRNENMAHLVVGLVALVAYYFASSNLQKNLTLLIGVVALYFGVHGLFLSPTINPNYFNVANLEYVQSILYLVFGVWGLKSGMDK